MQHRRTDLARCPVTLREPLRTFYTHEVLGMTTWQGRSVGGSQRLSIMLRVSPV